jgi:D-3-phosphoglycerate dehydrogenase
MPRLILIDEFRMEAYLDGILLFFVHRDVPGIIGRVGTIFGQHQVNIGQMSVGRASLQPGGNAIGVLNLDSFPPPQAIEQITAIDPIDRVQMIELPAAGQLPTWLQ